MDTPDLEGTVGAFNRVLRLQGIAILIFSHPCFPQGRTRISEDGETLEYIWESSYFEHQKCVDPPWGHFTSDFIWFHRPLSDYWKTFRANGFEILEFEEPRITEENHHLAADAEQLKNCMMRPNSVAFKLQKVSPIK